MSDVRFAFVHVPVKAARAVQTNKDAAERVPATLRASVTASRAACLQAQAALQHALHACKPSRGTLHATLRDADERARACEAVCASADAYATALLDAVAAAPSLAVAYTYCWTGALEGVECTVCSDYRYDLVCVYVNVGALLLHVAHACSTAPLTFAGESGYEKDVYRTLQRAAGVFALCAQLLRAMASQPVGFVDSTAALTTLRDAVDVLARAAVAQAQEVGVERAAAAHPKDDVDTPARLAHQAAVLWQGVAEGDGGAFARHVRCSDGVSSLADVAGVKREVYTALAHAHAAAYTLSSNVDAGLCYLRSANEMTAALTARAAALTKAMRKAAAAAEDEQSKQATPAVVVVDLLPWLEACVTTLRKRAERVQTLSTLAYGGKRVSANRMPALPPALALAAATPHSLPRPLPALPPLPPPPSLSASEAKAPMS